MGSAGLISGILDVFRLNLLLWSTLQIVASDPSPSPFLHTGHLQPQFYTKQIKPQNILNPVRLTKKYGYKVKQI